MKKLLKKLDIQDTNIPDNEAISFRLYEQQIDMSIADIEDVEYTKNLIHTFKNILDSDKEVSPEVTKLLHATNILNVLDICSQNTDASFVSMESYTINSNKEIINASIEKSLSVLDTLYTGLENKLTDSFLPYMKELISTRSMLLQTMIDSVASMDDRDFDTFSKTTKFASIIEASEFDSSIKIIHSCLDEARWIQLIRNISSARNLTSTITDKLVFDTTVFDAGYKTKKDVIKVLTSAKVKLPSFWKSLWSGFKTGFIPAMLIRGHAFAAINLGVFVAFIKRAERLIVETCKCLSGTKR